MNCQNIGMIVMWIVTLFHVTMAIWHAIKIKQTAEHSKLALAALDIYEAALARLKEKKE